MSSEIRNFRDLEGKRNREKDREREEERIRA